MMNLKEGVGSRSIAGGMTVLTLALAVGLGPLAPTRPADAELRCFSQEEVRAAMADRDRAFCTFFSEWCLAPDDEDAWLPWAAEVSYVEMTVMANCIGELSDDICERLYLCDDVESDTPTLPGRLIVRAFAVNGLDLEDGFTGKKFTVEHQ